MTKFTFHLGVTLRSYGNVEVEAASVEAALPLLTADFISENIAIDVTTTDSGQDIAIIDVRDDYHKVVGDWNGYQLPSPYDPPYAKAAPAVSETKTNLCTALRWALDKIPATSEAGQSATYAGAYEVLWAAEKAAPAAEGNVSADPVREAAPAMLAALKAVVAALNGRVHSQPALKALHDSESAIAAAEGRANG